MFESDEIAPRGHATVASSNSQQVTKRAVNDMKLGSQRPPNVARMSGSKNSSDSLL